jgi:tRNA pseudouridine55 synthase
VDGDKEYEFTIRWGEQRDTDDAEGKVVATSEKRPSESDIRRALPAFAGTISQTPPVFSAIKLDGKRAYDIARAGGTPELVERQVVIHALELTGVPDADRAIFRVHCGKGMYVRALARDLAQKLGTYGYITNLRRTRVGPFTLAQAVPMAKLEELNKQGSASSALLALRAGLGDAKTFEFTAVEAQKLRAGQRVLVRPQHGDMADKTMIFAEHQGVPVAVAEVKAGEFRVVRGFHF